MKLKVISPAEIVFEGEVDAVTLPGTMGRFTVLHNHAPLISSLEKGDIVYRKDQESQSHAIDGGIVAVDDNIISVCIS